MTWTFEGSKPIYQQIIARVEMAIANGSYSPGTKLPAVRELALEAGVNPNTMQRAFAELERSGLLHTERTSGRYVTDDRHILAQLKEDIADRTVGEMFAHLAALGMSNSEILEAVSRRADIVTKEEKMK